MRGGLIEGGAGSLLLMVQGAAAKNRLHNTSGERPESGSGENSFETSNAVLPTAALSVKFGRRLATATPIKALVEWTFSSAARTSGRCRTMTDGKLSGRSRGNFSDSSVNVCDGGLLESARSTP